LHSRFVHSAEDIPATRAAPGHRLKGIGPPGFIGNLASSLSGAGDIADSCLKGSERGQREHPAPLVWDGLSGLEGVDEVSRASLGIGEAPAGSRGARTLPEYPPSSGAITACPPIPYDVSWIGEKFQGFFATSAGASGITGRGLNSGYREQRFCGQVFSTRGFLRNGPGNHRPRVSVTDSPIGSRGLRKRFGTGRARLEARLPADVLEMLKRAAEIQGRTLTDFVVTAAREAAVHAIEEHHIIRLSLVDQRAIAEAILNPPEPNEALKRAFERRRELFGDD